MGTSWKTEVGSDCISLDEALCKWLGERLIFLGENCHSIPMIYVGRPDGIWEAELKANGSALLAYSEQKSDRVDALVKDYAAAQEAIRWVAGNLGDLWD